MDSKFSRTPNDFSKDTSDCFDRMSLEQMIDATFGHDDQMLSNAWDRIIESLADRIGIDPHDLDCLSEWCESKGVTEVDIAAVWNEGMRRLSLA